MKIRKLIKIYLSSCVAGFLGEGAMGWLIHFVTGDFLWVYPGSPFTTTSLYVMPLWGVSGLIYYSILWRIGCLKNMEGEVK